MALLFALPGGRFAARFCVTAGIALAGRPPCAPYGLGGSLADKCRGSTAGSPPAGCAAVLKLYETAVIMLAGRPPCAPYGLGGSLAYRCRDSTAGSPPAGCAVVLKLYETAVIALAGRPPCAPYGLGGSLADKCRSSTAGRPPAPALLRDYCHLRGGCMTKLRCSLL